MEIEYKGTKATTAEQVYEPSEDTFLLLDSLENIGLKKTHNVLEIGTGTGIIAIHIAKKTRHVTAIDINPYALECAKENAKQNNVKNITLFESNLFQKVHGKFDLILFNPPYLPTAKDEVYDEPITQAWYGGTSGRKTTDLFLEKAPEHLNDDGQIVILDSSKAQYQKTINILKKRGFDVKIIKTLNLFFEELVVILAKLTRII